MEPEERSNGSSASGATAWWIAVGVLVVAVIGVWIWKGVAVDRAEDRLETARAEMRERAREALARRTETLLVLSAEPLGLAVRDAAMERNWGTVGAYLDRVARIEGVQRVAFVAGDTVRVATDSSLEGRPAAGIVPADLGGAEEVRVVRDDGTFHAAVPITGLNERIGVLVLTYVPRDAPFAEPGEGAAGDAAEDAPASDAGAPEGEAAPGGEATGG